MGSQPAAKSYVEGSAKILGATGLPSDLTTGIWLWPGNGKPNPGGKLAGSSSPLGGGGFTYRAGEPSDEVARWRGEGRVGNAYLAAGRPPVLFRSSFGGGGDLEEEGCDGREGRGGCSSLSPWLWAARASRWSQKRKTTGAGGAEGSRVARARVRKFEPRGATGRGRLGSARVGPGPDHQSGRGSGPSPRSFRGVGRQNPQKGDHRLMGGSGTALRTTPIRRFDPVIHVDVAI